MDQLKTILAHAKKHHFWILTGVLLLVGIVGWYLATRDLRNAYASNAATINETFSAVSRVKLDPALANEKMIEQIESAKRELAKRVAIVWTNLYNAQRRGVLKWPETLGSAFADFANTHGPSRGMPPNMLDTYMNEIPTEFDRLVKLIDAQHFSEMDAGPGTQIKSMPGGPAPTRRPAAGSTDPAGPDQPRKRMPQEHRVYWNSGNQKLLQDSLYFGHRPSTEEVWQRQENLWIYEAVFGVIAKLNERATGHYNAKVKEIQEFQVGEPASITFRQGLRPGHITIQLSSDDIETLDTTSLGATPEGGDPNRTSRYVDTLGVGLTIDPNAPPPEFKRVPIYLRLSLDQRELSHFLTACANSPLPVEVKQLRINPAEKKGDRQGMPSIAPAEISHHDMVVDIYATVLMFNPPDYKRLEIDPATVPELAGAAAPKPAPGAAAEGEAGTSGG